MPLNEACMDLYPVPGGGSVSALSSGVNWGIRPRPDSDGNYGRLEALDVATRKPIWTVREHAPVTSGVLTTAGGLAMDATYDRVFHIYDSASGKELWHTRLNDVSSSSPITFAVNGKQYIALVVGRGRVPCPQLRAARAGIAQPPEPRLGGVGIRLTLKEER